MANKIKDYLEGATMIGMILAVILAVFIIAIGIWWNKKYHNEKFGDEFGSASSGSFIGDILAIIFLFIMKLLPWYVFKTFLILIGLLLIYAVIKS